MNIAPALQQTSHFPNPVIPRTLNAVDNSLQWLADGFKRDYEAHQFAGEKLAEGGSVGYRVLSEVLNKLGLTGSASGVKQFATHNEPALKVLAGFLIQVGEFGVTSVTSPLLAAATVAKFYLGSASSYLSKEAAQKTLETVV